MTSSTAPSSVYEEVPTYRPTWEEFQDFEAFVSSIEDALAVHGCCKVIPPAQWRPCEDPQKVYSEVNFEIPTPIRQYCAGSKGVYQQMHEESHKVDLRTFQSKIQDKKEFQQPPAVEDASWPTEEEVQKIERRYWKNVQFFPPIYGADVMMTLFDEKYCKTWNLNQLNDILQKKLAMHDIVIPGINASYLYVGSFKSTFCWHTEDLELFSINYNHFGAPKTWYTIPLAHKAKFEKLAALYFPQQHDQCRDFLRHKMTLISPTVLKQNDIRVGRIVQHPGEFVITSPGAYHGGFNQGFNCAEAVNFATERWVEIGRHASRCTCISDSVRINMDMFHPDYDPELGYIPGMEPDSDDPDDEEDEDDIEEMTPVVKIKLNKKKTKKKTNSNNNNSSKSNGTTRKNTVQQRRQRSTPSSPHPHWAPAPHMYNTLQTSPQQHQHSQQYNNYHMSQHDPVRRVVTNARTANRSDVKKSRKVKVKVCGENHDNDDVPYVPSDDSDDDYVDETELGMTSMQSVKWNRGQPPNSAISNGYHIAMASRFKNPGGLPVNRVVGGVSKSPRPIFTSTLPGGAIHVNPKPKPSKSSKKRHPIMAQFYSMSKSRR